MKHCPRCEVDVRPIQELAMTGAMGRGGGGVIDVCPACTAPLDGAEITAEPEAPAPRRAPKPTPEPATNGVNIIALARHRLEVIDAALAECHALKRERSVLLRMVRAADRAEARVAHTTRN